MTDRLRADRRIVFHGLGSLGVAAVLAGCGSDPAGETDGSGQDATSAGTSGGAGDDASAAGTVLASTDEVPVEGGILLRDERIVITQPTEGEFKAFTAVCTHQQCVVNEPDGDRITCSCHGSSFDAATGEVTGGPASSPLAEIAIAVQGSDIVQA